MKKLFTLFLVVCLLLPFSGAVFAEEVECPVRIPGSMKSYIRLSIERGTIIFEGQEIDGPFYNLDLEIRNFESPGNSNIPLNTCRDPSHIYLDGWVWYTNTDPGDRYPRMEDPLEWTDFDNPPEAKYYCVSADPYINDELITPGFYQVYDAKTKQLIYEYIESDTATLWTPIYNLVDRFYKSGMR